MKILSITHLHVVPNTSDLRSFSEHKLRYFWWTPRAFWSFIDSKGTTMIKAQERSKATGMLFVHKENKNNNFIQWFFSSASPYGCHLEDYHDTCTLSAKHKQGTDHARERVRAGKGPVCVVILSKMVPIGWRGGEESLHKVVIFVFFEFWKSILVAL